MPSTDMAPARKAAMTAKAFNTLLKNAGLSRTQAAKLLGVDRRTVIRWALDQSPISANAALAIHAAIPAK